MTETTDEAAARLTEAILKPLRDVGRLLAVEIDALRAEVAELRADFTAHRNDVDFAHKL